MHPRIPTAPLALAFLVWISSPLAAEEKAAAPADPGAGTLSAEITRQDAAMFDAFNAHDLPALMALFSPDLEFFHDQGGLQTYADVEAGFRRIFERNDGIRRQLVEGTLEIYPVPGYGAMEVGAHRFCHVENGKDDCGIFQFLQVWKQEGARWRVTRVMSWGH